MFFAIRVILAAILLAVANLLLWPPADLKIQRNPNRSNITTGFKARLETSRPQIVLVGNSVLGDSVNERIFSKYTNAPTIKFSHGGSASAWWYLVLKNAVFKTKHKPQMVVIFFRDHFLTDPGFRVNGDYKKNLIDKTAEENEPVLDRYAYFGEMNSASYLLFRYCPLYQKRDVVKTVAENFIKNKLVSNVLDLETPNAADDAIKRVFKEKKLDKKLLTIRQLTAESAGYNRRYEFSRELKQSFLPHIIEMAKQNNVQLVFVRTKKRRDVQVDSQSKELKNYIKQLGVYLQQNQIPLVDFTNEGRIKIEHYGQGDHLKKTTGKELFTKLLAEKMKNVIETLPPRSDSNK